MSLAVEDGSLSWPQNSPPAQTLSCSDVSTAPDDCSLAVALRRASDRSQAPIRCILAATELATVPQEKVHQNLQRNSAKNSATHESNATGPGTPDGTIFGLASTFSQPHLTAIQSMVSMPNTALMCVKICIPSQSHLRNPLLPFRCPPSAVRAHVLCPTPRAPCAMPRVRCPVLCACTDGDVPTVFDWTVVGGGDVLTTNCCHVGTLARSSFRL